MDQDNQSQDHQEQDSQKVALHADTHKLIKVVAVSLIGILSLGVLYTLHYAVDFVLPIVVAILLNVIFSPVSRRLLKRGIPETVSAFFIVSFLMVSMAFSITMLSAPITGWIDRLPTIAWKIETKMHDIMQPVEDMKKIKTQVDEIANSATVDETEKKDATVKIQGPSFSDQLFASIQYVLLQLSIVATLLFFLLASGDQFKERFVAMVPGLKGKKQVLTIMKKIEQDASTYILTRCAMNLALGAAIGLSLWALGIPNALLWGFMAFVLNFIPYIGVIIGVGIVFMVSLLSRESVSIILAAPLIYFSLSMIEGQFISPAILGRRLTISPVIVFVFVLFWGWLWGVPGAVMAVPILVVFRAFCDNIEGLHLVSMFLGSKPETST